LTGFVDLRKDPEKFSYDKWTASLTSTTRRFTLDQAVDLSFIGVGQEVIYQTLFKPATDCGLKTLIEKI
jgi:ribonuclease R